MWARLSGEHKGHFYSTVLISLREVRGKQKKDSTKPTSAVAEAILLLFLTRACCVYFLYFYAILHVMLRRNARVTGIVLGVFTATRSHGARVSRTFISSCNTTKIKVLFN